eukprot:scaffold5466_cov108-Skeletonema_menzelii.AAC.4
MMSPPQLTTNKRKRKRAPRTPSEVNSTYVGSLCCVRCLQKGRKCTFDDDDRQQCSECRKHGYNCQLSGTSYIHSRRESTLGKRQACLTCAARKQTCIYDEDDEWKYSNVSCAYCKEHNKNCWPLIKFSGMRSISSKLFSGVDNEVLSSNDACELLLAAVQEAADNFQATVDYPKNIGGFLSTQRPARSRNNYGTVVRSFNVNNRKYEEIVSYGSGCGATSVGTTQK